RSPSSLDFIFSWRKKSIINFKIKMYKWGCVHNFGLKYILEGQLIMYKLKEIKHALKILEQYDFQFSKTSKATGIKVRTIRCWYNKQKEGKPLLTRPNIHTRKGKWTVEEKKAILDYYFSHGENCSIAVRFLAIQQQAQ
ncbi:MAG: hypothetical protein SOV26_02680, partial [Candidatus Onthovivens sp.]|nr:hypothetical protein [Candidatus Onthovivens sp.]